MGITNQLFLSNQLDILAGCLQDALFGKDFSPFQKHFVLVPGEQIKNFILQRFARDPLLSVAAGVQIYDLQKGLSRILRCHFHNEPSAPSHLELSLQIESEIIGLLQNRDMQSQYKQVVKPLLDYLNIQEQATVISQKTRGRIVSLSLNLSQLFINYGLYPSEVIEEWLQNKGWQQFLWSRIFHNQLGHWTYPAKMVGKDFSIASPIHIFGFGFLPKSYVDFFKRARCIFYIHSPCQMFWEDLCTQKERMFLRRSLKMRGVSASQRQEFDGYLRNQNSILAGMGKVQSRFLRLLDDENMITEERYFEKEPQNLLQRVQNDLLFLESFEEKTGEENFSLADDLSIQLHGCSSKFREVEILKQNLLQIFAVEAKGGSLISPKDILVLSPDIQEYAPYIHMVFGSSEDPINYSIFDLELSSQSAFIHPFFHLLDLPEHRFDSDCILKFLHYPPFLEKFSFSEKDAAVIKDWVKRAKIYWGVDAQHKSILLDNESVNQENLKDLHIGTWEHAWELLLQKQGMIEGDENASYFRRIRELDWDDAELIGKFIYILQSIRKDLEPIVQKIECPLQAWMHYFRALAESYFSLAEEDLNILDSMHLITSHLSHLDDVSFPFSSTKRILEDLLKQRSGAFNRSLLNSVRFCSMKSGCVVPAKVICLMGLEEGVFPRSDPKNALNEISARTKEEVIPSKTELDRYVFLELLFNAKTHLILSFRNICPRDLQPQNPSIVVQELFTYLEKNYSKNRSLAVQIKNHPELEFDRNYFIKNTKLFNASKDAFLAAQAHYCTPMTPLPLFFPEFYGKSKLESQPYRSDAHISIQQLKRLSKNPIKFYFNQVLGMYLDEDLQDEDKNSEFILSYSDKAWLRDSALMISIEKVAETAYSKGHLPLGAFKEVALHRIENDVQKLRKNLEELQIDMSDIFSVDLKPSVSESYLTSTGSWMLPSIKLCMDEGYTLHLTGRLEGLTTKGLLANKEGKFEDLVEIWPLILVLLNLPEFGQKIPPQINFLKKGKSKQCNFPNPQESLKQFIRYFEICQNHVSPFMPKWAKALVYENQQDLQKELNRSLDFEQFKDPYLEWLFSRDARFDAASLLANWKDCIKQTFGDLAHFNLGKP